MAKEKKEKLTKVFEDEFKGNAMFSIWEVDEDGKRVGDYPIVNFGMTKAKAIVKHNEELLEFVDTE